MRFEADQLRFMVVEDDYSTLGVVEMFLTSEAHFSFPYLSPVRALREFSENPNSFDALLTDYQMPKMDGIELATGVRRIAPKLPIILSTAGNISEVENRTPEGLIDFYLKKPYSLEVFRGTVRQVERLILERRLPPR
jgi:DNA-binding NtrC family response regulator